MYIHFLSTRHRFVMEEKWINQLQARVTPLMKSHCHGEACASLHAIGKSFEAQLKSGQRVEEKEQGERERERYRCVKHRFHIVN